MAIVLARLFLVLARVFVSLLAWLFAFGDFLAWQLSWLRSRLCLARGMALVLAWVLSSLSFQLRVKLGMALVFTRVIAANDA